MNREINAFGKWLAAERKHRLKLTQHELAEALGIHQSMVSSVEKGRRMLGPAVLNKLSEVMGVAVSDMPFSERPNDAFGKHAELELIASTAQALGDVYVAKGTTIGHFAVLDGQMARIMVGPGCVIGHHVKLLSCMADEEGISHAGPLLIGEGCVIEAGATIAPGNELPPGAVIPAGVHVPFGKHLIAADESV